MILIPDGLKTFVGGRTDAEGRVRLPALARDRLLYVRITTNDYGVQRQQFRVKASEPAERTVYLRPVCRLEGRVIAEKPEWAHGKRFLFTTEKPFSPTERGRPPWPTEGIADVTTDKEGRFVVPTIAEGRLRMQHAVLDDTFARAATAAGPSQTLGRQDNRTRYSNAKVSGHSRLDHCQGHGQTASWNQNTRLLRRISTGH